MTKVHQKIIDSSAVNTASLLEIRNDNTANLLDIKNSVNESIKALSSCIEGFKNVQTELSLEVRSSTENIKTINRRQTEIDQLIAKIPEGIVSGQPELYNSTASDQGELANQHTKYHENFYNKVEAKLKLSARHLEKQFQSDLPSSSSLSTEDCPTSVLNSEEKNHTQGGETLSNSSSSQVGKYSNFDLTILGSSQVMKTCPTPDETERWDTATGPRRSKAKQLRSKSRALQAAWKSNNRFGILAEDSDGHSDSEDNDPATTTPALAVPATTNPTSTTPAPTD